MENLLVTLFFIINRKMEIVNDIITKYYMGHVLKKVRSIKL